MQHEPSVPPGVVEDVLTSSAVEHVVLEAWREPTWPAASDVAALVVLGGTMNVDELSRYPFLRSSRDLLSDALERGVPTMGVCLGSQMMSRVLGGDVYRAEPRNALFSGLEVGADAFADPVIAPFASGEPVLQFHEDTFTLPPGATPLARSAGTGLLQAFRYGDRAYAFQFHFEVDEDTLRGWCRNIGDTAMKEEWGVTTDALLAEADLHLEAQQRAGRELFTRFLEAAAVTPAA